MSSDDKPLNRMPPAALEQLGAALRELREQARLSLEEAAAGCERHGARVTAARLGSWERGLAEPVLHELVVLLRALDASLTDLQIALLQMEWRWANEEGLAACQSVARERGYKPFEQLLNLFAQAREKAPLYGVPLGQLVQRGVRVALSRALAEEERAELERRAELLTGVEEQAAQVGGEQKAREAVAWAKAVSEIVHQLITGAVWEGNDFFAQRSTLSGPGNAG